MTGPRDDLTPEQREQIERALSRGRAAVRGVTRAGIPGLLLRGVFGSAFRRLRLGGRAAALFGGGLVVVALSVVTCSAGVTVQSLTAEYGPPVPATPDAARRFVERAAAAMRRAPATRRLRITVSESEATSALSLGLMMPELARAMDGLPAEQVRQATDIESLRNLLRDHEAAQRDRRTFPQRVAAVFDPRLRTGDVQVRFTGTGAIVVAGYVQAWRWQQPVLVVFAPRAATGELELDFVKGRLGRLPAPAWAFDLVGRLAASLILQGQDAAEISDLTVEAGRLTFEARVTQ